MCFASLESVWMPKSCPSRATRKGCFSLHETPASPVGGATAPPWPSARIGGTGRTQRTQQRRRRFRRREHLSRGDAIEVEGSHSTLTYRVESIDVLSKDDFARNAEQIFDQTGAARLVVITCGDFDGTVWRSNVVIIAAPVS